MHVRLLSCVCYAKHLDGQRSIYRKTSFSDHYYQGRKDFSESLWPRVHLEDAVLWMRQPLAEPRASGGVNRGSWEEHWLFKLLGFKSGFIFTLPSQPVLLQVIELLKSTVMYCNWLLRGCCIDGTSILLYQCTKRRCGKKKKKKALEDNRSIWGLW